MILIDVLVPQLEKVFDFEIDENIKVNDLREYIEELIQEDQFVKFSTRKRELFLYRIGDFISENVPLISQGIRNGDRLILV